MKNIFGLIVSVIFIALVILCGKLFEKSGKEASRKFIHIMLSNWWIIAMIFFDNVWFAMILPFLFVIINYVSYKYNIIKVMERNDGDDEKESLGTVYYAISLLVLSLITFGPINNPLIGLCGIAVMGYADGLAAIVGQSLKSPVFKVGDSKKSLAGCTTMFLVTFIILTGFLAYTEVSYWFIKSILVAALITIVEAVSIKGTDNLTVPLLTSLLSFLMLY